MKDSKQSGKKRIKRLLIVGQDNKIIDIITPERLKSDERIINTPGLRIIETTGKEIEIIKTIVYKPVDITKDLNNIPFKDEQIIEQTKSRKKRSKKEVKNG